MKKLLTISALIIVAAAGSFLFSRFLLPSERGGREGFNNNSAEAAAPRSGLVGYWTMDANDVTVAAAFDKSGNNNNGAVYYLTEVPGKIKQALKMVSNPGGGGSYIQVSNAACSSTLNFGTGPFSIAFWYKATSTDVVANGSFVVSKGVPTAGGTNYGYAAGIYSDAMSFWVYDGTVTAAYDTAGVYRDGQWHHYVMVHGLYLNYNYIFRDGVQISNSGNGSGLSVNNTLNFAIGWIGGYYFAPGIVDDVRVYSRTLSNAEISQLYTSAAINYTPTPSRASSTPSAGNRLVGYWTMDSNDMSATKVYDKSGLNNTGTSANTPTIAVGKIKQAISFNGTSDFISVNSADTTSLGNLGNQITMSVWVYNNTANAGGYINKSSFADDYGDYYLIANTATRFSMSITSACSAITNGGDWVAQRWYHVVGTYNGSSCQIYANGVAVGSPGSGSGNVPNTDTIFRIGEWYNTDYLFNGSIDDVRIYNYALSAQEVANLYNSAARNYSVTPPRTGLVGYWTMDANDISGTTYYDKSGNNNTATSTASPTLVAGKIKQAVSLNGTSQYLRVTTANNSLFSLNTFTLAAWVYNNDDTDYKMLITKVSGSGTTGNYQLRMETATNAILFCGDATPNITTSYVVPHNVWTHIVATYDGTNGRVYANGNLVGGPTALTITANSQSVLIGERDDISGFSFGGRLDDVRIYNYALSAQEVMNLYQSSARDYK